MKKLTLEQRLKFMRLWSKDSTKLVPEEKLIKGNAPGILNRLMEKGFDVIDGLMNEYDEEIKKRPEIEKTFPKKEIYGMAIKCCKDLTKRWEKYYQEAKNKKLLDEHQIKSVEKDRYFRKPPQKLNQ